MENKLQEAIKYLRERKLYILEFTFKPTNAAQTDISMTIARYRREVLEQPFPVVLRKRR